MENINKFGERLLKLREERKETQQQLADAIGITRQSLSRYETNERTPNIELVYNIAKHFNVSADYLLGLSDNPTTDPDIQNACKVTGLSEEAIERLSSLQYCDFNALYNTSRIKVLDKLLNSRFLKSLLDSICRFQLASSDKSITAVTQEHYSSAQGLSVTLNKEETQLLFLTKCLNQLENMLKVDIAGEAVQISESQKNMLIGGVHNAEHNPTQE